MSRAETAATGPRDRAGFYRTTVVQATGSGGGPEYRAAFFRPPKVASLTVRYPPGTGLVRPPLPRPI